MAKQKFEFFLTAYRAGILIGFLILVIVLVGGKRLATHSESLAGLGWFFLVFGIAFVFFIGRQGFKVDEENRLIAGNKVQTAGYLYTLFGFSLILLMIRQEETPDIQALMFPMGGALITSILGWFLGGEISERTSKDAELSIEPATSRLISNLETFVGELEGVHQGYLTAMNGLIASHTELHGKHSEMIAKQEEALRHAVQLANDLGTELSPIHQTVLDFRDTMKSVLRELQASLGEDFRQALREIGAEAVNLRNSLGNATEATAGARQLIREIEKLSRELHYVHETYLTSVSELAASHAGIHEKHIEVLQKQEAALRQAAEIAGKLNNDLDPIHSTALDFGATVNKVQRALQENLGPTFQQTLKDIADEAVKARGGLKDAAGAAEETRKYLQQSRVLITELEQLLEAVAVEKGRYR